MLTLAFYLSVLTYYLGVLVIALPIPWYGIKRWGPILIVDGIKSAILVFSFNIILWSISYISEILQVNWESFNVWLASKISELILVYTFLFSLRSLATKLVGGFLGIITSPFLSLITYSIILLETFLIIGAIIHNYCSKLIALGILLHNVPFRISRAAGSTLIAFAIVYFLGLPLLPAFIDTVVTPLTPPNINIDALKSGVTYGKVYVCDIIENPIPYAILRIREIHDNNLLLALYIANSKGIIDATAMERGLPSNKEFLVEVEYLDETIPVNPNPVNPDHHYQWVSKDKYVKLKLRSTNTIIFKGIALIFQEGIVVKKIMTNSTAIKLNITCNENKLLKILIPHGIKLKEAYDNSTPLNILSKGASEWHGVKYFKYHIKILKGSHRLSIYFDFNDFNIDNVKPDVNELPYVSKLLGGRNVIELIHKFMAFFFFTYFIAPLSYFFILISITYGLALFIGGRRAMRIPVRVL